MRASSSCTAKAWRPCGRSTIPTSRAGSSNAGTASAAGRSARGLRGGINGSDPVGHTLTRTVGSGASWPRTTSIIVGVLLAFAIFWDTERIARATGEAFAQDILVYPWQLVAVTVYSEKRLELAVPGVTESELRPDSAYHFRYTGLRLLEGTHDRYVLLGENGGNIVVLKDEQGLRFEFSR